MRLWFSILFLVFSVIFTLISINDLDFLSSNRRPSAGFFPTIIGISLIILTATNLIKESKAKREDERGYTKDVMWVIIFITAFIAVLKVFGALISMIVFTFAILLYLNRGKMIQNVLVSIIFPVLLFALFEMWLNAGLPKGFFGF